MTTQINSSDPTYLVGYYQDNEFWCSGEFSCKHQAEAAFCNQTQFQPQKHIVLIQKIVMHKVLDTHYPKHENV
jgi:hypothetical protein